jgi:2,4-dienoyl-CoA reductase-like NADH-dependent reductase (Old Yellow Enzyme family)
VTRLFEAASIAGMELRNRVVKSATIENMATAEGLPTEATGRFYERLARGGAGLIVTGYAYVDGAGRTYPRQNGAHTDAVVSRWRPITAAVHAHGARIAMQIVHGGRQVKPSAGRDRPLAPSVSPNLVDFTMARQMSDDEIRRTIDDFGRAAARAREAGFDAVQIHAAHGYLLSSFLSPLTNRRRDEWGGDARRRLAFPLAVYRSVRKAVGADFPVLCKLNVNDFVLVGLRPRHGFDAAVALADEGLDGLEISGGVNETVMAMMRGDSPAKILGRGRSTLAGLYLRSVLAAEKRIFPFRENYFLPYAAQLKKLTDIPLILVGGVRRVEEAERILGRGEADFISMARPLIREPGLPGRWERGDRREAQCTSCNRCLGEIDRGEPLRCYAAKRAKGKRKL